ncbi:hypothetical protein [Candidatus Pelagibacter sp. HIMB1542]
MIGENDIVILRKLMFVKFMIKKKVNNMIKENIILSENILEKF